MHFLFPSDPLKSRQPDEFYSDQVEALRKAGFESSVVSMEELQAGSKKVFPQIPSGSTIVYRGWMLSPEEYDILIQLIAAGGAKALTPKDAYLAAHYLPNWYPLISEFTPETQIFPPETDLRAELDKLNWGKYFIKDYVKSLKTSVGSIVEKPAEIQTLAGEMQKFRGKIEGGFCVRRVEPFLPKTERRFFVLEGTPHGPSADQPIPEAVKECAHRIPSQFFAIDIITREDGVDRVVEVGDGQVSDLVGWTADRFADIWC